MNRSILAAALLLLSAGLPVAAQEATPEAAPLLPNSLCQFDLSNIVATLTRAQAVAGSGDNGQALGLIQRADTALAVLEDRCLLPAVEPTVALSQTLTLGEGDAGFTIAFPEGWVAQQTGQPATPSAVLATDDDAAALMTEQNPALQSGQAGILLVYGSIGRLTGNMTQTGTLETVARYYQALLGQQYTLGGDIAYYSVDGRAVAALDFTGDTVDGVVRIVEIAPGARYAVLAGAAAQGEAADLVAISDAVAAAIQPVEAN